MRKIKGKTKVHKLVLTCARMIHLTSFSSVTQYLLRSLYKLGLSLINIFFSVFDLCPQVLWIFKILLYDFALSFLLHYDSWYSLYTS